MRKDKMNMDIKEAKKVLAENGYVVIKEKEAVIEFDGIKLMRKSDNSKMKLNVGSLTPSYIYFDNCTFDDDIKVVLDGNNISVEELFEYAELDSDSE